MFCYLHLFIYVKISWFYWIYFTSFFEPYIEQNIFLFIKEQSPGDLQNRCSKSIEKYESIEKQIEICLWKCLIRIKIARYKSVILKKINFFICIFQTFWSYNQLDTPQNRYSEEYLFLWNTFFNGYFCSFIKFQWLIDTFLSYGNFCMKYY